MEFDKNSIKTLAGVVAGVGVGALVLKSKNLLILTAFGVGGGMLANYIVKKMDKDSKADEYLKTVKRDIENTLVTEEEKQNFYGVNKEMVYNNELGLESPIDYNIIEDAPKNYMDIDLGRN